MNQYFSLNGKLHQSMRLPRLQKQDNYTRAYYCTTNIHNDNFSGDMIVSGASEERCLRFSSSITGELLLEAELYPGRVNDSLYVQVCSPPYLPVC